LLTDVVEKFGAISLLFDKGSLTFSADEAV
jgi:hypothetical protein